MIVDLNADLGEGAGTDAALLKLVTSASVNCGFHAADAETVRATLEQAAVAGVSVGAHPGYADREHFGRREMVLESRQIATQLFHQVGALQGLARITRAELRYLKPHGALYNQACRDLAYAQPVAAAAFVNSLAVVGLPGSQLAVACGKLSLPFFAEGFVDRRYREDGTLVPRSEANAMIHDAAEAVSQAEWLVKAKAVRTLCVHGDTPAAVEFAAKVREKLLASGFHLKAFA